MPIGVDARHNESQRVTGIEDTDLGLIILVRIGTRQLWIRWSLERPELRHLLLFECPFLSIPDFLQ